jgi:hypothetical protein
MTATRWRWRRALSAGFVLASLAGCGSDTDGVGLTPAGDAAAVTYDYVIPAGSGERIDAGEPLDIFPRELTVHVGEVIRIANLDDRGHTVGPFFVGANETLLQTFTSPGEFEGECSVHPSGEMILTVEP